MMNLRIVKYVSIIIVMLIAYSCEKDFDPNLGQKKRLVALAAIELGEPLSVVVSTNSVSSGDEISYPENAEVTILEGDREVARGIYMAENDNLAPFYQVDFDFKAGNEYGLMVENDDFETIFSQTIIPTSPIEYDINMQSSKIDSSDVNFDYYSLEYTLDFKGQVQAENFYQLSVLRTYEFLPLGIKVPEAISTSIIEAVDYTIMYHENGFLFKGEDILKFNSSLSIISTILWGPSFESKGEIILDVRKISEDYYKFHRSVAKQETSNREGGFLIPPAGNFFNNIENGFGNFSSYISNRQALDW